MDPAAIYIPTLHKTAFLSQSFLIASSLQFSSPLFTSVPPSSKGETGKHTASADGQLKHKMQVSPPCTHLSPVFQEPPFSLVFLPPISYVEEEISSHHGVILHSPQSKLPPSFHSSPFLQRLEGSWSGEEAGHPRLFFPTSLGQSAGCNYWQFSKGCGLVSTFFVLTYGFQPPILGQMGKISCNIPLEQQQ